MPGLEPAPIASRWVACFAPLLLAGCATSQLDLAPEASDRPVQFETAVNGEILPGRSPAPGAPAQGYVLPTNSSLASLPALPTVDAAAVYDLADLIDLAESHNPETRIAWNAARDVALAAGIARSTYLPRLTATALGGYQTAHGRASTFGLGSSADTSATGSVSVLSLQWLLFDFGERHAIVESADQATVAANIAFTGVHQRLIHQVSLAFYTYSAARDRSDNASRSLEDARRVQTAAEERFRRGIGTVVEVAQAKLATAEANLFQVRARGAMDDGYANLMTAMGFPPLVRMTLASSSQHALSPALGNDVEEIISTALGRRPDVLAAYSALKASLANERAAKAEFLPKVFMSANTAFATGDLSVTGVPAIGPDQPATLNVTDHRSSGSIMVGITVPLFDGGTRKALLAQARTRADTARVALERAQDNAIQQIVLADNALHTGLAAHDAAEELRSAAQITFDATLAAYRNGVGTSTEVLVAERQLLEARNAYSDSHGAALSAAATLALATGGLGGSP
ncbi:MAG: TolC family protein [Gammaproteobacteria bacterium]